MTNNTDNNSKQINTGVTTVNLIKLYYTRSLLVLAGVFLTALDPRPLYANPQSPIIVAGDASFSNPNANTLNVNQNTNQAIINWQSFSINNGETTHFNQPSADAIALNRVTGSDASKIFGTLSANGRIMLVNQNGIWFGPNSVVNVGGLIATTAHITNNDFLSGNYHFMQNPNKNFGIINEGTITVADKGLVALVAPGVENRGVIQANLGKVVLASGKEFTVVDTYGDQLIQFAAGSETTQKAISPADDNVMNDAVRNSGAIYANGGTVVMSAHAAANVVDHVVNMDGIVQANSVSQHGGTIILAGSNSGVAKVSGKVYAKSNAAGVKGGKVQITGQYVGLFDGADIDASGIAGGGEILIGGDYQGKNSNIFNATATYVDPNASIKANALTNGNGGKVIVWADDATRAYGTISAQGGSKSGNGGFVETSGRNYLDVNGISVNLNNPNGQVGTWLLDPINIYIALNQTNATAAGMSGTNTSANIGSGGNPNTFQASGGTKDSLLTTGSLTTALATANVIVTTTKGSNNIVNGVGNITIVDPIVWSSSNSLTLTAGNDIAINNSITASGAANVILVSGTGGNITLNTGTISTGSGTITFVAGQNFINNVGANVFNPGTGRWLIWSINPTNDVRGGLVYNFKQYNAVYNLTSIAQTTGNGFLYSTAPTITASIGGTISKTYDGNASAGISSGNFLVSGTIFDGDTINLISNSATYSDKNVGSNKLVTANDISIASANNGAANVYGYTLGSTTASANIGLITPATLTYKANTASMIYGNSIPSLSGTVTGFVGGETQASATTGSLAFTSSATNTSNVGSYAVNGSGLTANNSNYTFTQAAGNANALTINPAMLTVTPNAVSTTYNAVALNNVTYSNNTNNYNITGFKNGQTVASAGITLSGSMAFNSSTSTVVKNAGTYTQAAGTLVISSNNNNYVMNFTNPTPNNYVITPANLTITGIVASNKVYNANTTATLTNFGSLNGILGSDVVTLNTGSVVGNFSDKNVANGKAVTASNYALTGTDAGNYVINSGANTEATTANITPAPITVTAQTDNRVYNGTTSSSVAPIVTGTLFGSDSITTAASQVFNDKNVGTNKILTASGLVINEANNGNNYSISYVNNNTGVITPAQLTASIINNPTKIYNGNTTATLSSSNYNLAGFVTGEGATLNQTSGNYNSANVLNANTVTTILSSGDFTANSGTLLSNYQLPTSASGAGSITPRPITVTANSDQTKVYGSNDPILGYSTNNLASEEVLNGSLSRMSGQDVGNYLIQQGSVTNANNPNYNINYVGNEFVITKAWLTITANDAKRSVDTPNPSFSVTYNGLKYNDNSSVVSSLIIKTPATQNSPAGQYVITPSNAIAANYNIVFVDGTLTVLPNTRAITTVNPTDTAKYNLIPNVLFGNEIYDDDTSSALDNDVIIIIEPGIFPPTLSSYLYANNLNISLTSLNIDNPIKSENILMHY